MGTMTKWPVQKHTEHHKTRSKQRRKTYIQMCDGKPCQTLHVPRLKTAVYLQKCNERETEIATSVVECNECRFMLIAFVRMNGCLHPVLQYYVDHNNSNPDLLQLRVLLARK